MFQDYRWTISAKECYRRQKAGLGCKGCFYEDFFTKPRNMKEWKLSEYATCQMKKSIIELVKTIGAPTDE